MTSQLTRLTVTWLEAQEDDFGEAEGDLVWHLEELGNNAEQTRYLMNYSVEMTALEGETLTEVIETEALLARMQELIR